MIDVHNHSLYGVDDGSDSLELSLEMLRFAREQGVTDVILTPHFRKDMFSYPLSRIINYFTVLKNEINERQIPIRIYLGCEYHVDEQILYNLGSNRVRGLAGTDYVLTEYSFDTPFSYMLQQTESLMEYGYFPVIAHVERYRCLQKKPKLCSRLQVAGAKIQCNADALLGYDGKTLQRTVLKLVKHEWVDLIASDTHDLGERSNHLEEAYSFVESKYSKGYAEWLFTESPGKILKARKS